MINRKTIDKMGEAAADLDSIDYYIEVLKGFAAAVHELEFQQVDIMLETLPKNGARPFIKPLYPVEQLMVPPGLPFGPGPDDPQKPPQPVGFQRWYDIKQLDEKEGMCTVTLTFDHVIASAMIDTALNRLKKRRTTIIRDTNKMIKPR
jgi:hypothetical protein